MTSALHYSETISGKETIETITAWRAEYPGMGLLALVAEADREREVPAIQEFCNRMNLPLFGAVFPAVIFQARFLGRGSVLIRLDRMPYALLSRSFKTADSSWTEVRTSLAAELDRRTGSSRGGALFLIFDAMVGNIATLLDDLYLTLADRVRYMGVNAGSETFKPIPCLFDNRRSVQDGVIALILDDHPGAAIEHCYQAPERLISATATEGNRIISIDWRPAFEAYQEAVKREYGVEIDRENFYQYAVHFPFGIVRAGGEVVVRIPVALEPDGSLFCVGEVPANAVLTLLRAPGVDSVKTVDTLVRSLNTLSGDVTGADVVTFYCAGRKMHLNDRAGWELEELEKRSNAHIAGALSLGEIGHSLQWGYPLFHNGALVCFRRGGK